MIHKAKNEGLGQARNTGLENCSGQWVMFIDSDDWIDKTTLQEMNELICSNSSVDVVVYGYAQEFEQEDGHKMFTTEVIPNKKNISGMKVIANAAIELDYERNFSYVWNKLYRKEIICNYKVRFTSTPLIEDFLFNVEVFKKCNRLLVLDKMFYHYRKPRHETLVSKYVSDFYELCKLKYTKERDLLTRYGIPDEKTKEMLAIIHMKHILSTYMKECSAKSGNNILIQYKKIGAVLKDPVTVKSIADLNTKNKKMQLLKSIIQTQNTFLNFCLAKGAIVIQQKMPKVWNRFL